MNSRTGGMIGAAILFGAYALHSHYGFIAYHTWRVLTLLTTGYHHSY